ncbi:MAG: hypothetical protein ACYDG2_13865 [Ruminiclostridium sp.]
MTELDELGKDLKSYLDLEMVYLAYRNNTSALRVYMERQWNFVASIASTFNHMRL